MRQKELENLGILLKGATRELTHRHPGIWFNGLGGGRDIRGKTELCGTGVKAGGSATIVALSGAPAFSPQTSAI